MEVASGLLIDIFEMPRARMCRNNGHLLASFRKKKQERRARRTLAGQT